MGLSIGANNVTNVTNITQNFGSHGCGSPVKELAQQQALLDGIMNSGLSQSDKSALLDVLKENGMLPSDPGKLGELMEGMCPFDRARVEQGMENLSDCITDLVNKAADLENKTSGNKSEGSGGALSEFRGGGSWLRDLAETLGEMLDAKANELKSMAEKMAAAEKEKGSGGGLLDGVTGMLGDIGGLAGGAMGGPIGSMIGGAAGNMLSNMIGGGGAGGGGGADGTMPSDTALYQAAAQEFSQIMDATINAIKTLGQAMDTAVKQ